MLALSSQLFWLFLLAIPVACVAWTVTHEEVFREPRAFCIKHSIKGTSIAERKFFYLFTCEYCFSHYVTLVFLFLTNFKMLLPDWRGYVIAGFSVIWIANLYMSLFGLLRQEIKKDKTEISELEKDLLQQTNKK